MEKYKLKNVIKFWSDQDPFITRAGDLLIYRILNPKL